MITNSNTYVAKSTINGAGFGVFAAKDFRKDETVEICPVIILRKDEGEICEKTTLGHYMFEWEPNNGYCIALGYSSIYNHQERSKANVTWIDNDNSKGIDESKRNTKEFYAVRPIKKGEEMFIDYGWDEEYPKEWGIKKEPFLTAAGRMYSTKKSHK